MIIAVPVVLICLPIVWLILQLIFPIEIKDITKAKKEIQKQVAFQGKISNNELKVLTILLITIVLWIFISPLPFYGLATVALIGAVMLFITGCIQWKDIENRVPWGIILLYGGAITLGVGMASTGAGEWIANGIFNIAGNNPIIIILVMIVFTVLLTNIMSNVAAVAILLPIGISILSAIDFNPLLAAMIIALSGGLAFMFVISTPGNAITYSSGYYSTKDLFKAGLFANIMCIIIIFAIAIIYWMGVLKLHII